MDRQFHEPAGMVTQAIPTHTGARVVGICDCDYFGLNHLGWLSAVFRRGTEVTNLLLNYDAKLASLYPSALFDPQLIRSLGLIPTEYLFF